MPNVEMPNGDVVAFPDDMPSEQIKSLIVQKFPDVEQAPQQEQAQQTTREIGKTESAITGFGQGATANFGDEILAGVGAPVIYGGSRLAEKMPSVKLLASGLGFDTKPSANKPLRQIYREQQLQNQNTVRAAEKANPGTYLAGNVVGSFYGAGKLAKTVPGNMTANFLRTGSLPVRIAKNAAVGFGTSALAGAGAADSDKIGQDALTSGGTGAAISATVPVIGSALGKAFSNSQKPAQRTASNIQDLARQAYKEADEKAGVLTNRIVDEAVDKVQGMTPQTEFGKILAGDSPFTKLAEKISMFKGKNMSLEAAQEIDQILGDQIDNFVDRTTGKVTAEGLKIQKVQDAFRESIENAKEADVIGGKDGFNAIKKGRELWSQASKLRDVERIITRAEMTDNPKTALKTGFRNLYNNPSRMRGFKENERKLVKNAAESGIIGDIAGTMGSRLIPIGAVVGGGGLTGTAASQLGTMAARSGATKLQANRAAKLANAIANRGVAQPAAQMPRYPLLPPALAASLSTQNTQ